jgi:hypothetical protein
MNSTTPLLQRSGWFARGIALALVPLLGACPAALELGPPRVEVGASPNSVALARCGDARVAVVAASAAARVDVVAVDSDENADGFGDVVGAVGFAAGSSPWMVAARPGHPEQVLVTLFGEGAVAVVDVCAGVEVGRVVVDVVIDLDRALTPLVPIDADGDGATDATVTRMRLRTPQAVAVDDDGFAWVTFTNVIEPALPDHPMVAGPGALVRVGVSDAGDALVVDDHRVVPCDNPQGLAVDGDDVWVTCTGHFQNQNGGLVRASPGGIVRVARQTFDVVIAANADESFGTPVVFRGEPPGVLGVGSVLGSGVFTLFDAGLNVVRDRAIAGADESLFKAVVVDGELAVTRFINGDLILDPLGTARIVRFSPPGTLPRGLVDVVVDADQTAVGVFTLSSELVRAEVP